MFRPRCITIYQNASYAGAKCQFAAKSLQDVIMIAQIAMRLTLRLFKQENREVSIMLILTQKCSDVTVQAAIFLK